ncbi:MAG: ribosome maturation factor RimM [Campylobacterota bacterium]|nr:ribosome maturation factor RimM [Campylobacterota bacterium]
MSNQSSKKPSLLHVATLGRTIGLKGDMNFIIKTDFPEQFIAGAEFVDSKGSSITLSDVNLKRETVKINGIATPESAKKFVNAKLFTTFEKTRETCQLGEGEFFWFDIIGCSVIEDGRELGVVKEIERMSITDYLSVTTESSLVARGEAKEFLIPYHPPFIVHSDVERKEIEVSGAYDLLQAS